MINYVVVFVWSEWKRVPIDIQTIFILFLLVYNTVICSSRSEVQIIHPLYYKTDCVCALVLFEAMLTPVSQIHSSCQFYTLYPQEYEFLGFSTYVIWFIVSNRFSARIHKFDLDGIRFVIACIFYHLFFLNSDQKQIIFLNCNILTTLLYCFHK